MTEHPNATLIRQGYAAFSAGDVATLTELIAPDAVQHMPGSNRFSGDHPGMQEILRMYGQFAVETQGTFKVDLEELCANDDTVVTVYRATGERGGEHTDTRHAPCSPCTWAGPWTSSISRQTQKRSTSSGRDARNREV